MNVKIKAIEEQYLKKDLNKFDNFKVGNLVAVSIEIKEEKRTRQQIFRGIVIAKKNGGINSAFTVRKMSGNIGVERVFPLHSPIISSIKVEKTYKIRKAKLYYLRDKAKKLKEKFIKKNKNKKSSVKNDKIDSEKAK